VTVNRITLKDIAIKANVSLMTVSRVLNNRPDVKPETRKKIQDLVAELGYIPDTNARVLKGGQSNRIGVVVSDIKNPFYSELVGEIEDQAGIRNLSIVVADNNKRMEGERAAIQSLLSTFVDLLIIAPEGYRTEHLDNLLRKGIPFVSFGVHFGKKPYNEIWIEDIPGGELAGKRFSDLGIARPLLLMGHPKKTTTLSRIGGFIKGYTEAGGTRDNVSIVHLEVDWRISARYVAERLLTDRHDGIFCYNDWMAMGALRALHGLGLSPGKQIPLIGYDDVSLAEVLGLTTIKIPIREMVHRLFLMIEKKEEGKIQFSPSIILRETA